MSDSYAPLGEGNFSTVVVCRHKVTGERFALKIIEKEECKKLAKRQHPNVYNEVAMERRVLALGRLPGHVNVIRSYHAMQGERISFGLRAPRNGGEMPNAFRFLR